MDNKSCDTEMIYNKAMNNKKAAMQKKKKKKIGKALHLSQLLRLLNSALSNRAVIVCLKAEIQWGCGKSKHGNTMGQAVSLKEFIFFISN